jgi:hypothetical protein
METTAFIFALVGISFGTMGFITASANSTKIKQLTTKVEELTDKLNGEEK